MLNLMLSYSGFVSVRRRMINYSLLRYVVQITALLCIAIAGISPAMAKTPDKEFAAAGKSYAKAKYAKARAQYTAACGGGIKDACYKLAKMLEGMPMISLSGNIIKPRATLVSQPLAMIWA
jgi:hypothetical protein